ncbi:MAG: GH3 auxin-responsive promoter family protein [Clostridia bacterium]|nr:GH3 auxin-responsive promoter family protein [Clostridia bacterium]
MAICDLLFKTGIFLGDLVYKGFEHFSSDAAGTQEKLLKKILKKNANTEYGKKYGFADIKNADEYREKVPMVSFKDLAEYVDRTAHGERNILTKSHIRCYISSSGTSGTPKVVPISKKSQWNLQCMGFVAPEALAAKYAKEHYGRHLHTGKGMLAWLIIKNYYQPDGSLVSDFCSLPLVHLRWFVGLFNTTPRSIMFTDEYETIDSSYLLLRYSLPYKDMSYIGSMIITITYALFNYLEDHWQELCDDIEKGVIGDTANLSPKVRSKLEKKLKPMPQRAAELRREFEKGFDPVDGEPIASRIWPKLDWIYGMMGSTIHVYAEKLKRYIGDIPIHSIGYGASEGYIAMPVEMNASDAVILPKSQFYEFLELDREDDSHTLLLNEVEVGKSYELVFTNLSGFYRYTLGDVVKVTGFYNNSPRIEFLYRANVTLNLCDEKTTQAMVDIAVGIMSEETGIDVRYYSIYGDSSGDFAHYTLLVEASPDTVLSKELAERASEAFDTAMCKTNIEYKLYRDIGSMDRAGVLFVENGAYELYRDERRKSGHNVNQMKPVQLINTPEKKDFFFSRIVEL